MVPIRWRRRGWTRGNPGSSRVTALCARYRPNADVGTSSYGYSNTHTYSDTSAHANPYAHTYSDTSAHANPYAHTYPNTDSHANNPYAHTYSDTNAHVNPYAHTYPNTDSHANNPYAAYPNTDSHANNPYAAYPNIDSHANPYADTYPSSSLDNLHEPRPQLRLLHKVPAALDDSPAGEAHGNSVPGRSGRTQDFRQKPYRQTPRSPVC